MNANPLNKLRSAIEEVDSAIITLIAERMSLACAIGALKAEDGRAITDPAREAAVVANAARLARAVGLPEADIRAVYWQLVALARNAQIREQHLSLPTPG